MGKPSARLAAAIGTTGVVLLLLVVPAADAAVDFRPKVGYAATEPFALATGDFNADGIVDVATSNEFGTAFSALLGNGDGTLQAPRDRTGAGTQEYEIAAGDFDSDDRDDVVLLDLGTSTATRYLSQGDGTFGAGASDAVGSFPQDVVAAHLDLDPDVDLAVTSQGSDRVDILLNDGAGNFTAAANVPHALTGDPAGIAAADFDGDGDDDLAFGTTGGGDIALALNNGSATFAAPISLGTGGQRPAVGDFNGDGRPDLAVSRTTSGDVAVLLRNAANAGFDLAPSFDPVPSAFTILSQVTTGDLDADGVLDLAVPNINGPQAGKVSVGIGRGDGQFDLGTHEPAGTQVRDVATGDLDRDGNLDLVTSNSGTDDVAVLLAVPPAVAITPPALAFGDQVPDTSSVEQRVDLRNDGKPRLRLGTVAMGGVSSAEFTVTTDTCTSAVLATGESCALGVVFRPGGLGARDAALSIPSNGGGAPQTVALTGNGAVPATPAPTPPVVRPPPAGPLPGACANVRNGTPRVDTLVGTTGGDRLVGLAGKDVLRGLAGDDCLLGGRGNDTASGGSGNDRVRGGGGGDRLTGDAGRDDVNGDAGSDVLSGGSGDDVLRGAAGRDRIRGGPGRNRVSGGPGNDTIDARNRRVERIDCGTGRRDRVRADRRDRLVGCERVRRR